MDLLELDRRALRATGALVARTEDSDLDRPTPCDGWDGRALLNHVVGGNWMLAVAGTDPSPDWSRRSADHLGWDHRSAYEESRTAVTAAFARKGALDAKFTLPFGVLPGSLAVAIHFVDVLVHGWDLAVAIGHEPRLDPLLCAEALRIAKSYPEESWGDPRFFAHKITLAEDAPIQDRLVAYLGRDIKRSTRA
jgi:uncharacterized protein (TIGR03086 family)